MLTELQIAFQYKSTKSRELVSRMTFCNEQRSISHPNCGQYLSLDIYKGQFAAFPTQRVRLQGRYCVQADKSIQLDHPKPSTTTALLTVLIVEPGAPISEDWIQSSLRVLLEDESPLDSAFAKTLLIIGVKPTDIHVEQQAWQLLQQKGNERVFVPGSDPEHDYEQGRHIYHNASMWQAFKLHDDTTGAFMTAVALSQTGSK